ncbi:MAG: peptidoglycan DD-metalloendopeptidase family protein [Burkholderiales bacterium]
MKLLSSRQSWMVISVLSVCLLAACTSRPRGPIPVEDRVAGQSTSRPVQRVQPQAASDSARVTAPVATSSPVSMGPAMAGSENAGKPGYYSVRPGDTLTKIALDHGQAWRDIAKWNGLENPNMIEVDQVLRVAPPLMEAAANRQTKPVMAQNQVPPSSATNSTPTPTATSAATSNTPSASPPANASDDGMSFAWPHPGPVLAGFDEAKNKGLDFAGKAGDPVLAAGDGKVVYAGSGLRGYGNLVILKHNNTYLTAYAHNQTLLVKEDQNVTKGQRIADMGSSDSDRVKLHFEIRKQGKPVDPAKLLPARP